MQASSYIVPLLALVLLVAPNVDGAGRGALNLPSSRSPNHMYRWNVQSRGIPPDAFFTLEPAGNLCAKKINDFHLVGPDGKPANIDCFHAPNLSCDLVEPKVCTTVPDADRHPFKFCLYGQATPVGDTRCLVSQQAEPRVTGQLGVNNMGYCYSDFIADTIAQNAAYGRPAWQIEVQVNKGEPYKRIPFGPFVPA
ncbi:uncharacterized protein PSFLO_03046 [Pseudozyma flocculosa]|uniref:Uncharacterized protein n=1 Tax=Pseudozyma flocculosa TaxID=84751 RepID=A0A5C3F2M9_9BASI|nr:uncharacterized protein PSFLO_03046 [Pseudozyma flocculosa]